MAIARLDSNLWQNQVEAVKAFHEAFPNADQIELPEGAQDYKLFRVSGNVKVFRPNGIKVESIPEGDDIITLNFGVPLAALQKGDNKLKLIGWAPVWYNTMRGNKVVKKLGDVI